MSNIIFPDFSGIIRDYDALNNKPTINGIELVNEIGNNPDYIDDTPTEGSIKLMNSGGIKETLEGYYTEAEADELLSGKSDIDHIHDDRYYTESETDELLSGKSDVGHTHDDRYYTESETDGLLSGKSDVGHTHPWYEIVDVPGTRGNEFVERLTLDDLYKGAYDKSWAQFFDNTATVNAGDVLDITITLADKTEYYRRCEVFSNDYGNLLYIAFNNTAINEENVDSDGGLDPVPEVEGSPSFLIMTMKDSTDMEIWCADDYTGAEIEILRETFVKLSNDALHVTDEVIEGSEELVTSGAVYEALTEVEAGANAVSSVNGMKGNVTLGPADVGALPASTVIPTVPTNVSAFTNDAGYITEYQSLEGYAKIEDIPTVPTNVSAFTNDAGYLTEHQSLDGYAKTEDIPTVPTNVSAFTNDAGYLTQHQSLEGYIKSSQVDASPTQGSGNPVSSGGVYEALAEAGAGAVTSVNGKTGAVTLSAGDVGALPSSTVIPTVPTNVSAFTNDAGYLTEHQSLDGYAKTEDIPTVPANVSDFNNDAGYVTTEHSHNWEDIEEKPGTTVSEDIASLLLDDLYKGAYDYSWAQFFDGTATVNAGDVLQVKITLSNGSSYTEECEVFTDGDGYLLFISFNNTALTKDNVLSGGSLAPVATDSSKPCFLIHTMVGDPAMEISCAGDYTGATVDITKSFTVKLSNDALYVTDEVTEGSDELVTSGGVYEALAEAGAGAVTSVNGKTGAVTLSAGDVGALPSSTVIPTVPTNVSAFTNDAGYLTEHQSLDGYAKTEDIPTVPTNVSAFTNDAGYLTEHQSLEGYIKSSQVDASPTQGSGNPVSSGGVYEALAEAGAGAVTSVNGKTGAVTLSAGDVEALPSSTVIPTVPTNVSAFTNDAGYLTEHQSLEGYAKTEDIPTVPTKVSAFTNDAGYLTEHQSLDGYAKTEDIPTVPTNVSAFTNDAGYLTQHQSLEGYAKTEDIPTVPTNVSAFTNDAGYLTQHQSLEGYAKTEDIPTVPTKVSAFTNDAGYLTQHQSLDGYAKTEDIPTVPTKVSAFTNDAGYLTEHQSLEGYAKTEDIPTVPTKVSAFTNDAGYLTQHQSLEGYAKTEDIPTVPTNVSAFTNDAGYITADDVGEIAVPQNISAFTNDVGYVTSEHSHNWEDIEEKPGTVREDNICESVLNDLYYGGYASGCWDQTVSGKEIMTTGEVVDVSITLSSGSTYSESCEVFTDSSTVMQYISFNNSALTKENASSGDFAPVAIDTSKPSFLILTMETASDMDIICAGEYTGAAIKITRSVAVKLSNDALHVTDEVTEGSEELVTSGAVYEALSGIESGSTSVSKPVILTAVAVPQSAAKGELTFTDADPYSTIASAYENGESIFIDIDIGQLQSGMRCMGNLTIFSAGSSALFEMIVSPASGISTHVACYILPGGGHNYEMKELVNTSMTSGLTFSVSSTAPTVDDSSVITFVTEG